MKWRVHGRRIAYASKWVNVCLEDVEVPGGERFEHHALRMPRQSVAVVVFDGRAERVLLLWRHRFITDEWGWEVPAGWKDPGEPALDAAQREVEEETGWLPSPLTELCRYSSLPGISDLRCTIFRADGATHRGDPPDRSEATRIEWVAIDALPSLIDDRAITDGQTLTALSFALAFDERR